MAYNGMQIKEVAEGEARSEATLSSLTLFPHRGEGG
ncbi:unnamed protein product, partial [marine sediment metagenome]